MDTPQTVRRDDAISLDSDGDRTPWWVAIFGGIALFGLGLVILLLPGLTLALVMGFVGLFWLVDGVVGLACILADRTNWVWKLIAGILGVVGGLFVIQYLFRDDSVVPILSSFVVGVIGILIGLIQLLLTSRGTGWRTGIPGVVSIAIGLLLALMPAIGAVLLPFALAGLAVAGGVAAIVGCFKRRSTETRRTTRRTAG